MILRVSSVLCSASEITPNLSIATTLIVYLITVYNHMSLLAGKTGHQFEQHALPEH